MKIKQKYNITAVVLLVLALLTACRRTELCFDHYPTLTLGLSWEHEWERDYGMNHATTWDAAHHGYGYDDVRPTLPEWVNMVISNPDGTTGERYLNPEGGKVSVDLGDSNSYLLYNGDTEYIVLSNMVSLTEARATATSRSRANLSYMNEQHPDARSTNPPDVLYASYVKDTPTFGIHDHLSLDVKMQPLVYTYVIRYEFEYGVQHIHLARGALGGMAESVYLHDGSTSNESSIILYDCDVVDYGCHAQVRSFGIPGFPDEYYGRSSESTDDRTYTLNLEVMMTNGETLQFNFDVSKQIKSQPRGGVITVSGIRIEDDQNKKPITSGSFDVDLGGWDRVDVELPLPDYNKQ